MKPDAEPNHPVPGMGAADPLERGGMPAARKRYRLRHPEREASLGVLENHLEEAALYLETRS